MKKQLSKRIKEVSIEKNIDELLTLILEDKRRNHLLPNIDSKLFKNEFRAQVNSEIAQCTEEFNRRLRLGLSAIWNKLCNFDRGSADQALSEVQEIMDYFNQEKDNTHFIEQRMKDSQSIRIFMGLSDKTLDNFYQIARKLYEEKDYATAADCFFFLCTIDPLVYVFWLGYGHSEHLLNRFNSALHAYAMATLMNSADPTPHYLSAQCYEQMNNISEAIHAIELAIANAEGLQQAKLKEILLKMKNKLNQ